MSKQGHVLVVDNDPFWCNALVKILKEGGFDADSVVKVDEAVEKLRAALYHILVVDVRMKDADPTNQEGIDILSKLKDLGLKEAMKVIMISAYPDTEKLRRAFRDFEVADFLFKNDFHEEECLETVRRVFAEKVKINLALDIRWQQLSGPGQAVLNLAVDGTRVQRNTPLQS